MARIPSLFGPDLLGGGPNLLTRDLAAFGIIPPLWGIFNEDGEAVVTADNVVAMEYKNEWSVADAPLERGAFESYDKVDTPFSVRLTFSSGGSFRNRQALLDSIDEIAPDINKYDVVTPEKTYVSMNVVHVDYRRTATNGAGLISVSVWLQQIREDAVAETANSAEPSGATVKDGGQVQPKEMSPAEKSLIRSAWDS